MNWLTQCSALACGAFSFTQANPRDAANAQAKRWRLKIKAMQREITRGITASKNEERRVVNQARADLRTGKITDARPIAHAVAHSRKHRAAMFSHSARLTGIANEIAYRGKLEGVMRFSHDAMRSLNSLTNLSQIREDVLAMSREMHKAGCIEAALDEITDPADSAAEEAGTDDDEAEAIVNAALAEILNKKAPLLSEAALQKLETREQHAFPDVPDESFYSDSELLPESMKK